MTHIVTPSQKIRKCFCRCLSNVAFLFAVACVCVSVGTRAALLHHRAVLAPIVTLTKLQIYKASGREMAKPQLHSRSCSDRDVLSTGSVGQPCCIKLLPINSDSSEMRPWSDLPTCRTKSSAGGWVTVCVIYCIYTVTINTASQRC